MNPAKSFFPFSLFILLSFFLSGCFEYEETITIRKDGSGEMAVHYFGPEDSDIDVDGFKLNTKDEQKSREYLERKFSGPGLRLKNYESKIRGDEQHVYFIVAFEQFTNLARARWWSDQNLDAGQRDGRNYWKRLLKNNDNDWDKDSGRFGDWVKEKVADELAAHIKLRFVIETDGEIVDTNARDRMPRRAVWRFDGGDLLKPEGLDMRLTWK
jgi:hypothetical protein